MKKIIKEDGLPELKLFDKATLAFDKVADIQTLDLIKYNGITYPVRAIVIGNPDPEAPCLCLTGGVHGVERIGTHIIIAFLRTLGAYLKWSETIDSMLKKIRLAIIPIVNPVGMMLNRRGNGNRVDLMRNAPIDSLEVKWYQIFSGQRFSKFVNWYRGEGLERESELMLNFVRLNCFQSKFSISLDLHSGFGFRDRIWFPYSYTRKPPPNLAEIYRLRKLLREVFPHHVYKFEPQTNQYLIQGDLWDFLYKDYQKEGQGLYLPLTLEMGSWQWLRKSPLQILTRAGIFNPLKTHRYHRVLRRHLHLLDFLINACISHDKWLAEVKDKEQDIRKRALQKWYGS